MMCSIFKRTTELFNGSSIGKNLIAEKMGHKWTEAPLPGQPLPNDAEAQPNVTEPQLKVFRHTAGNKGHSIYKISKTNCI